MKQFDFGRNWLSFSRRAVSREGFNAARKDFLALLDGIDLSGKQFLDIGFGQGFSLLIAAKEGANVTGCDINPGCKEALELTASTLDLPTPSPIVIGSILENATVTKLQTVQPNGYDIVHAWGVLHHTGDMNRAIQHAASLTAPGGHLVLALYNRHWSSPLWRIVKCCHVHLPAVMQKLLSTIFIPVLFLAKLAVTRSNPLQQQRGMDFFHDVTDWVGGYPYEYATVEEVKAIVEPLGFYCRKVAAAQVPTGCNEFVFTKNGD